MTLKNPRAEAEFTRNIQLSPEPLLPLSAQPQKMSRRPLFSTQEPLSSLYSTVVSGRYYCPSAGLRHTEYWVECARNERGLGVARVRLFFPFEVGDLFSCALIHRFCESFDDPNPDNGMWVIEHDLDSNKYRVTSVMHVDSMVRAAQRHSPSLQR
ncbi:hypothetical protein BDM02DRAFT_3119784 [Thelephora ganbajun]|uniref:Uncharacterized protein n=1 Tax=Thelephora ganbajun TaxID=370292 RepID=A0ACB6Z862_THEGA|nr:hypothetical protein BDM02DRAFT_3119784 [Thelephora ganbajun]